MPLPQGSRWRCGPSSSSLGHLLNNARRQTHEQRRRQQAEASGRPVLRRSECLEASLSSRKLALDTICHWIGDITAVSGDLDAIDPIRYVLASVAARWLGGRGSVGRLRHAGEFSSGGPPPSTLLTPPTPPGTATGLRRHRSCAPLLGSTNRRRRHSSTPHEKLSHRSRQVLTSSPYSSAQGFVTVMTVPSESPSGSVLAPGS